MIDGFSDLRGDLVDLVDVDDAGLGALHVVVRRLDQFQQDVLDVLTHVARLGQRGGIGDGEGHVEHAGQGLGQQRLAAPGRTQEQDVGLGQLHVVVVAGVVSGLDPLVVVVDGDRQDLLRVLLTDHVVVQELVDLLGLGKLLEGEFGGVGQLLGDDVVAQFDALVADVDPGTGDQLLDLLLRLAAEAALHQIATVSELRHVGSSCPSVSGACCPSVPAHHARPVTPVRPSCRPTLPDPTELLPDTAARRHCFPAFGSRGSLAQDDPPVPHLQP